MKIFFLRTKTRCLEENEEKHGRKENSERKRKKENKREAHRASLNYAEELGPLLFLGRRSGKIRYQTLLWFFCRMIKLYRARSLLYRRQNLQQNIRWKALDEIYKIYMLLHRSDLNISARVLETFSYFCSKFCKQTVFFSAFHQILRIFWWFFSKFRRMFNILEDY